MRRLYWLSAPIALALWFALGESDFALVGAGAVLCICALIYWLGVAKASGESFQPHGKWHFIAFVGAAALAAATRPLLEELAILFYMLFFAIIWLTMVGGIVAHRVTAPTAQIRRANYAPLLALLTFCAGVYTWFVVQGASDLSPTLVPVFGALGVAVACAVWPVSRPSS